RKDGKTQVLDAVESPVGEVAIERMVPVPPEGSLVGVLEQFEPFGQENRQPQFMATDMEVTDVRPVGNDGKHLRLIVQQGGLQRKLIAFGTGKTWGTSLQAGHRIDIVYELSVNEWNGSRELQLKLVDWKVTT
ncbi:MAG: hypothetical protein V1916_02695, partial [Patescibacteria group bacterium]